MLSVNYFLHASREQLFYFFTICVYLFTKHILNNGFLWHYCPLSMARNSKQAKHPYKALPMLFLWLVVVGAISFLVLFIYIELTLPAPESIAVRKITESTKIYDKTGEVLLYDIHGEEKRTIIPWAQIPESAK